MYSLAGADKTKPILPAVSVAGLPDLKRQLYRIYSSTHLLVNPSAPGRPYRGNQDKVLLRRNLNDSYKPP